MHRDPRWLVALCLLFPPACTGQIQDGAGPEPGAPPSTSSPPGTSGPPGAAGPPPGVSPPPAPGTLPPGTPPPSSVACTGTSVGGSRWRRLTAVQYRNTV